MDPDIWMELEVRAAGGEVWVAAKDAGGDRAEARSLGPGSGERLTRVSAAIEAAVARRQPLGEAWLAELRSLHAAVFQGAVRDLLMRVTGAARDSRVLLRLIAEGSDLKRVPWEALCEPGTGAGFLGTSPRLSLARSVAAPDPVARFNVRGALRVLAVAPTHDRDALLGIERALGPRVATGEIEWMPPIVGAEARAGLVFQALRRGPSPHVIHFLGHGGFDAGGDAVLRFADSGGEASFVKAEVLAQELAAGVEKGLADGLRLCVLESCEGAAAGNRPSAAELLVKAGAVAVVAHAFPVDQPVARDSARDFYFTLVEGGASQGDVAASLNAVRRTLLGDLGQSAEGFSPVLHLRGPSARLFDFEGRRLSAPREATTEEARSLDPALRKLVSAPFTLLLGDAGHDPQIGAEELRGALEADFEEDGHAIAAGLPLDVLTQRHALHFGPAMLDRRSEEVLKRIQRPPPPGIEALARLLPPGVHTTLHWLPLLERALAQAHPDWTIYAVQPDAREPLVVRRAAGKAEWRVPLKLPKTIDLKNETIVLRLYGGLAANDGDTSTLLTEDEHFLGLSSFERSLPPDWADLILGSLREPTRPALIVGLSVLHEWRHRMLLAALFRGKPMTGSVALLPTTADADEEEVWEAGERLPIDGSIPVVRGEPDDFAPALRSLPPSRRPS